MIRVAVYWRRHRVVAIYCRRQASIFSLWADRDYQTRVSDTLALRMEVF